VGKAISLWSLQRRIQEETNGFSIPKKRLPIRAWEEQKYFEDEKDRKTSLKLPFLKFTEIRDLPATDGNLFQILLKRIVISQVIDGDERDIE
jgi:hypothetical protein